VLRDDGAGGEHTVPDFSRAVAVLLVGLSLWWSPIIAVGLWQGWNSTLFQEGLFFSKAAVVTFGGAYAVLPYVAQQAVETYGWLAPGQMMDGLGLAETTPGPLIMVLQFVGFIGGWNQSGALPPLLTATLGALITTWATFVPCFIWILLGAPYVEALRGNRPLAGALGAVTAAVVGVILNLAIWFGGHVLFPPGRGIDWLAVVICIVAFVGMLKWRWDVIRVVFGSAVAGLLYWLAVSLLSRGTLT
jgi:chromate transporter